MGFGGRYAPIALHAETDSIDDPTGVRYDGVTGIDKPLLAEPTPPDSSQLPAGVVQINRENYMMVTTVRDRRRRQPRRPCARHHLGALYLDTIWVPTLGAGLDRLRGRLALRGHGHARHDASINDCPARISSARVYPLMFADAGDEAGVGVQVDPIADVGAISSTLGAISIVEFGYPGRAVARLGAAFGMTVLVNTAHPDPVESAAEFVDRDTAVAAADYLSLHTRSDATTRKMIGPGALRAMKTTAILINTARGSLVDEDALADALQSGQIAGAALDVLNVEPLPASSRLRGLDNVLITSHLAGQTIQARARAGLAAAHAVIDVLDGREPNHPVNRS